MNRNWVWVALGILALIVIGWIVASLFRFILYLILGALVVGGVLYFMGLFGRSKSGFRKPRP
jgi:hypothetical protein